MKQTNALKKLLCTLLAISVFAVSIPFTAIAATTDSVNFGILSDIHYFAESAMGETDEDKKEFNEMMLLNNSTSGLSPALTEAALANLAEMAKKGEIDFLLLPGDLTKNSEYKGHVELAERLAKFEKDTGIPVYVINGNHDINNTSAYEYDGEELVDTKITSPEEFEEIYKDFGYSPEGGYYNRYKEAGNTEGSLSYATDINDDYRLIAIDSQKYSADNTASGTDEHETAGEMSEALIEWSVKECEKAVKDGKTIIGMTHTNVVPHFDVENDLFDQFILYDWQIAADALADAGMHYIVSGHTHIQDVASYVSDNGETITDVVTSSILSFPNMFRTVTIDTYSTGRLDMEYRSHDVDETIPVYVDGIAQEKPFKYLSWEYNFGGENIKNFVTNLLEYQLIYGFGKDVKDAGGLYKYLKSVLDMNALMTDLLGSKLLGGISATAINALLLSLCNQVEELYLSDPDATLEKVSPILDKFLAVEISDEPSTIWRDTLGFGSENDRGTLGDLASTVLANHCLNNEDPKNDKFLMSALERFYNGENAEIIVDALFEIVLDDLLLNTILEDINIDPVSMGIHGFGGNYVEAAVDEINDILDTDGILAIDLQDIVTIILNLGVLEGDTLKEVVYSLLDEYLTESQYDIIDQEFYRIMKDLTHDENPVYMGDHQGKISYNGKVEVPLSTYNYRLPSHIAITFGEDSATTRNISYFTKYSLTSTDVQIVPYSENPDFSKGTTVDVTIETECEERAHREYAGIDLGFIGIIQHQVDVLNRHYIFISDLEPDTKYCYRIGDAERGWWSDIGVIDTADNSDSFSFFHMTDPQSTTQRQYDEVYAEALELAFGNHAAEFIVNTGDMVDQGGDLRQWQRVFNSASDELMDTVVMSSSGNHEEYGDYAQVNNFIYSNLPEQDTTTGVYYSFDYNNAHFAILNSNDLGEDNGLSAEQIEWLTEDMSNSDADWKFVALHKAPYSNGSHFDDDDVIAIRAQLQGLMPQLGIDLVFQGHDHVYMRTDVMNDNVVIAAETEKISHNGLDYTAKLNPDGTIYSINGTIGVKHYKAKPESETSELFPVAEVAITELDLPSYSYIQVDSDTLYFDSYAVDVENGTEDRIDQFAIRKTINEDEEPITPPVEDEPTTDEPVTEPEAEEPTTDEPVTEPEADEPTTGKPITDVDIPQTSADPRDAYGVIIFMVVAVAITGYVSFKKSKKTITNK